MNLDYYAVLKEVRTLVNQSGLNLVFEKGRMPRTDGKTMYVQQPDSRWSERELTIWKGLVYHEAGHNEEAMRDAFDVLKEIKVPLNSVFAHGLNILDDYRQEKYNHGMYLGRDRTLSLMNCYIVEEILEKKPPTPESSNKLDDSEIADVLAGWGIFARQYWQRDTIGQDIGWSALFREDQLEKYNILCSDWTTELDNVVTAKDEWNLLLEILEKVFERDAEDELEQAQQQQQQAEENGEGQDGDGSGKEGEASGEGKESKGQSAKDGSGKLADGKRAEAKGKGGVVKYEDILIHNHEESHKGGTSYAPLRIDYSGYDGDGGFEIEENPKILNHEASDHGTREGYVVAVNALHSNNGLANKVRKLLQVMTQSVKIHGQKKGKVSNKSVYRAGIKNTGAQQRRIFSKKEIKFDLDVAVTVLVDNSGSMGGSKFAHATKSGLMLNEAVSKIGVPVEILGFTDTYSGPTHHIYKTFHGRVDNNTLTYRMCGGAKDMGGNADGEAILWAYDRLTRQPNKRKLLIVLSDGQPASNRGDADALTKKVVKQIEKDKRAEIYGIGIQSSAVERYYYHNAVIDNPDQLEQAVLTVVRNHILS